VCIRVLKVSTRAVCFWVVVCQWVVSSPSAAADEPTQPPAASSASEWAAAWAAPRSAPCWPILWAVERTWSGSRDTGWEPELEAGMKPMLSPFATMSTHQFLARYRAPGGLCRLGPAHPHRGVFDTSDSARDLRKVRGIDPEVVLQTNRRPTAR
jgi:hypothetical protein